MFASRSENIQTQVYMQVGLFAGKSIQVYHFQVIKRRWTCPSPSCCHLLWNFLWYCKMLGCCLNLISIHRKERGDTLVFIRNDQWSLTTGISNFIWSPKLLVFSSGCGVGVSGCDSSIMVFSSGCDSSIKSSPASHAPLWVHNTA